MTINMLLWVILLSALTNVCDGFWFWNFWATNRCYDRIGCFDNRSPFNNAEGEVPKSPEEIAPDFLLHTRKNPEREQFIHPLIRESLVNSNFDPTRNTKIIIHGYIQNGRASWIKELTSTILIKDDVNVIDVNWVRGSLNINYAQAAANTRVVGALIAELIQSLNDDTGAPLDSFHLIGHSLGAHVAGYAGQRLKNLGRITGLDPAGPLFLNTDQLVRLDPTDAKFVDVIHTDGDRWGGFGMFPAVGKVDFYPNGGKHQTGCGTEAVGRAIDELTHLELTEFSNEFGCDHIRAVDLFISSVHAPCEACACPETNPFGFGPDCRERCIVMGYNLDISEAHGVYYSTTKPEAPFCDVTVETEIEK